MGLYEPHDGIGGKSRQQPGGLMRPAIAYAVVTFGYWGFTLTDGAIRMLVLLYFYKLGFTPLQLAMLFVLYELMGIFTNALGGWLASRMGLNVTMHVGMLLQIAALLLLSVPDSWLTVLYVMLLQALSGVAKDLNKMSAKASLKNLLPEQATSRLFVWVSALTGSKNALKGVGFFLGAVLLAALDFRGALWALAAGLVVVFLITLLLLPKDLGKAKVKPAFSQIFANSAAINWLSAARFFLFGARDIWFVVALPIFLYGVLGWTFVQVGSFMAAWVIGYGAIQALTPLFFKGKATAVQARVQALLLLLIPLTMAWLLAQNLLPAAWVVIGGLALFGLSFAINSALHSYLILYYADGDKVALNVGFYYMANAGGRLAGTIISGLGYQAFGFVGVLLLAVAFIALAWLLTFFLPPVKENRKVSF
jgi:predicted MFS family arabinose efflux permease